MSSAAFNPADFFVANPALRAAGWNLEQFLANPAHAIRTVLFPPEPDPRAPYLPLLDAQRHAALRAETYGCGGYRPPPMLSRARLSAIQPSGPRPLVLRNGALFEPLSHASDHRARYHFLARPLARIRAARAGRG